MRNRIHLLLAMTLSLCIATGISAQETTEKSQKAKVQKKERKNKAQKQQIQRLEKRVTRMLEAVELTEDQKKKLGSLIEENVESLKVYQEKVNEFIDKDERKVVSAAVKKGREAGKSWPETMKSAYEEIGLSEEDQETVRTINKQRNDLLDKIKKEIVATFSEEQKKALKAARKGKGGKGKAGKGKAGKGKAGKGQGKKKD